MAILVSVSTVGCAVFPGSKSYDIEGKWYWSQNPWHGYFVLERDGDSYSGTLDDIFEGTYDDEISDVKVTGTDIEFTRNGRFGVQYWHGTLKFEDDVLKIVNGQWRKKAGISGTFYAEKRD
jgi:hypothetical protein